MAGTGKPVRLGMAARELNVGMNTIVEFLADKGIQVDSAPNSKLDADAYALLVQAFQKDQLLKEQSSKIANRTREERETITLESSRVTEIEEEPDIADSYNPPAPKPKPEPTPAPVAEKKEVVAPPAPVEEAIKAEKPAEVKPEPAKAEPEEVADKKVEDTSETTKSKSSGMEVKVLGKVDLDALDSGKSKKKAEKAAADKKQAEEAESKAAAAVKAEEPKVAPPDELIRAKADKLAGPTVVGKIILPTQPERKKSKPVASSSDDELKKKRKRKRIAKVEVGQQSTAGKKRPKKDDKKTEVTEKDIQKEIKETLARLSNKGKSKGSKLRRQKRDAVAQRTEEELLRAQEEQLVLKLTEFVTVSELASMMNAQATEIISACMALGIFASINQRLDAETITIIAEEFGYTVEFVSAEVQEAIEVEEDSAESLISRPPIVTVMGHVDHGKTSLLDYIRKANVIAGEAGGITQHIGAYSVVLNNDRRMTFLDTPGHEAFTAMRARGARVTDLAIIVIAADDAVMPQTKEAISHAQAANIPMIFAINKVDKPNANPDKIKEELSQLNILVEDWGGKFQSQEISAKQGDGVEDLLEKVLLEADLLELKANPDKRANGTVIESTLDKGRGYVTTLLVEGGTLRVGDSILAGQWSGRVKAMHNERGHKIEDAGPAVPVSILGMDGAPNAGDKFYGMEDEREARNIALKRQQLQREQGIRAHKHITIEEIGRRIALGEFKELNLIVKGDVDGSVEALTDSLQKLSTEKVLVNVIHKAVGQISESDVLLATASDAIIIGFQVRPSSSARNLAEKEGIQIRSYSVIYAAIDEVKEAMEGLLSAKIVEKILGTAEIRETFKITKVGTIAGCFMLDGTISRNSTIRVIRDGIVIHTGLLGSLKRFKDDVKDVKKGFECGLNIAKFNDIKEGDMIEAYEQVEVKQTLD
jgi:translation initiation factor IF-2